MPASRFHTVFLDRDGVINKDSPLHIRSPEELTFIPGSLEAIAALTRHNMKIFIITNQSGIGRGLFSEAMLGKIHEKLMKSVTAYNGIIADIFYCPHKPEDNCRCRKPLPGMILEACTRYTINLDSACMVGDSCKDIACARTAGVNTCVLVKTGNGQTAKTELQQHGIKLDFYADNLLQAAQWMINSTD